MLPLLARIVAKVVTAALEDNSDESRQGLSEVVSVIHVMMMMLMMWRREEGIIHDRDRDTHVHLSAKCNCNNTKNRASKNKGPATRSNWLRNRLPAIT